MGRRLGAIGLALAILVVAGAAWLQITGTSLWVPPAVHQASSGDGWRLLGSGSWGTPYSVEFIDDERALAIDERLYGLNDLGPVDWDREAVVLLTTTVSGSCPWVRFDGLGRDGDLVYGRIADQQQLVIGPHSCTADANPHSFLVAVRRSWLPARPFTLRLTRQIRCVGCGGSEEVMVH